MTKLNQIIAIEKGVKAAAVKNLTAAYQALEKRDQLLGFSKTYRPKDEEGEKLPSENKKVQWSTNGMIAALRYDIVRMFDVVATKELANTTAKADVIVGGNVLIKDCPVTTLLFLEKQLIDLHTFVSKLPTLSPDQDWTLDPVSGYFRTPERETHRTKKITKHVVVVPPTDKHPAQVATTTEDVIDGYWSTINFSGESSPVVVKKILSRIEDMQRAVQYAREQANSVDVVDQKIGDNLFSFIFLD